MRETRDVTSAVQRMVRSLGERIGQEDPADLRYLELVEFAVANARANAIDGLRDHGYTDVQIGEALCMSRQAVQQRWPRRVRVVGAAARYQQVQPTLGYDLPDEAA